MSEAFDDDEDPEPVTFIRMRAEDTFDGQERVMIKAAYDLQVRATRHSASCGHPGYVPDDYLEHVASSVSNGEIFLVHCPIGEYVVPKGTALNSSDQGKRTKTDGFGVPAGVLGV